MIWHGSSTLGRYLTSIQCNQFFGDRRCVTNYANIDALSEEPTSSATNIGSHRSPVDNSLAAWFSLLDRVWCYHTTEINHYPSWRSLAANAVGVFTNDQFHVLATRNPVASDKAGSNCPEFLHYGGLVRNGEHWSVLFEGREKHEDIVEHEMRMRRENDPMRHVGDSGDGGASSKVQCEVLKLSDGHRRQAFLLDVCLIGTHSD